MRTVFWRPTSVIHECRQCDDLGGLWSAFVDEVVVGSTQNDGVDMRARSEEGPLNPPASSLPPA
jgi:hypothetical protein